MSLYALFSYQPFRYQDYDYPWWGEFIGIMMTLSSAGLIPLYAIYRFIVNKKRLKDVSFKNYINNSETVNKNYFILSHFQILSPDNELSYPDEKKTLQSDLSI